MSSPPKAPRYIVGLDYGTESARGVRIDVDTGEQSASHVHPYRHGVMTNAPRDGAPLGRGWALQDPADYVEAAEAILSTLGAGRHIEGIGLGFTASSPMPATAAGEALSTLLPDEPHAYVKLWKHGAAQRYADQINEKGGAFLANFGGKVSGEWLLAKATQIAAEAPTVWAKTERFIEAGDWLVWQLTGNEARSLGLAAFKAQYSASDGYPDVLEGLSSRLSEPLRVGSAAGRLSEAWRRRTGIVGEAVVAVAVIDSHVVLPAVGGVTNGCLVAALGTSAAYLYVADGYKPPPGGIEGVAYDAALRDLWCYETGQPGFGDTLAWFVKAFPRGNDVAESYRFYNDEASSLTPGEGRLVALDWWNGSRVPFADANVSGLLLGLTTQTSAAHIYRAILESLCFGARTILRLFESGGLPVERIILTSGLADKNPLLVQMIADVCGRTVEVPELADTTAVGAAIHGAVAAGLLDGYARGTERFGARHFTVVHPNLPAAHRYAELYDYYHQLGASTEIRAVMHGLAGAR